MHIYLMRHGQTDWNIVHRMQGRSDIPLNATGLKQARAAAHGMDELPIDRILTSPLRRARQTAQAVAAGRGVPVLVEDDIIEMAFGELEGQLLSDFPACECIFSDPEHYVPLEEHFHDVMLVSHGAFIRGVVRRVLDLPLKDFWSAPPQPNCSCTVLELKDGVCTLIEEGRIYG